jgi:hypothetical protein
VLTLLQLILKRSKLEEHLFLELNKTPVRDTCFDEIQKLRRDVGGLIKSICLCFESSAIYSFFTTALKQALELLSQSENMQDAPAKAA